MAKPVENTERISTYITPEMRVNLEQIAKCNGMTLSGFIRFILSREMQNPTNIFEGIVFTEPTGNGFADLFPKGE